eukprot:11224118-Karenia_brevis.AAC.1
MAMRPAQHKSIWRLQLQMHVSSRSKEYLATSSLLLSVEPRVPIGASPLSLRVSPRPAAQAQ